MGEKETTDDQTAHSCTDLFIPKIFFNSLSGAKFYGTFFKFQETIPDLKEVNAIKHYSSIWQEQ